MHIGAAPCLRALRSDKQNADAGDVLQAALAEFQAAHDGVLPLSANDALETFVFLLEDAGHFTRGEKVLLAHLAHPINLQQRRWLNERLDRLYHHALQKGGDVSLSKGRALYQALDARLRKHLAGSEPDDRYRTIALLCQVYRTAHDKKLPGVRTDLKGFAFELLPPILKQANNRGNAVSVVAQTVHDLGEPRDAIGFLLDEIESEPRWLRYSNQDGWSRHGRTLALWRMEAKNLGDVEGRLLKLVLAELRRDLETREQTNRAIYFERNDKQFWQEKAGAFAKTAEAVLAEHRESGPAVQYIADYFYWGLKQPRRAIEILFAAHQQKLLDETGQAKLIDFLFRENRHGDAIPVLQPLVLRKAAWRISRIA